MHCSASPLMGGRACGDLLALRGGGYVGAQRARTCGGVLPSRVSCEALPGMINASAIVTLADNCQKWGRSDLCCVHV